MQPSPTSSRAPKNWPSARQFTEAIQCPVVCFTDPNLRSTLPAVDRLGMPLVTSGQFAFVYKLKSTNNNGDFAVRCFRGYLGDRDQRYRAIQRHLLAHPIPLLTDFAYAPEGILVSGQRYPTLSMKWIDGPTLDLYIDEMINRREVLLHLSQEWLKLVAALREAGIAHGDLQHGNIIVEHGTLRLVDHDGLFVPEMEGWQSSEVGHQHFQHPHRDADYFCADLDNFSSLVIYLTLISLMERPGLWAEHHDENLLFTKADFLNPSASTLFTKIKDIGPEHRHLAEVLETAATGEPSAVPYLLDLATIKSNLPVWMNDVPLEGKVKTRESQTRAPLTREYPRWIPKAAATRSNVPSTPGSTTVQSIFGNPLAPAVPYGLPGITNPLDLWPNTPKFAKDFMTKTFIWWYWGIYIFLKIFGLDFVPALLLAIFTVVTSCAVLGFVRSYQLQQTTLKGMSHPNPLSITQSQPAAALPVAAPQQGPLSITAKDPLIGNTALNIYHLTDCEWVHKILNKNRVTFTSAREAVQAGFKPCHVCSRSN